MLKCSVNNSINSIKAHTHTHTFSILRICSWSINVATGHHILLEFLEFDLENDTLCHSDQLTVFEGVNRVIGEELKPKVILHKTTSSCITDLRAL